jgi:hypothetical protein
MKAMKRRAIVVVLVSAIAIFGANAGGMIDGWRGESSVPVAAAASVGVTVDNIAFSEHVDQAALPSNPMVDFDKTTPRVWMSFSFNNYSGERMSYTVNANGSHWQDGGLNCCGDNSSGQFAFPIERNSGKDLGGAGYHVRIFANGVEVGRSGFGVRGTRGFDHDNDNN